MCKYQQTLMNENESLTNKLPLDLILKIFKNYKYHMLYGVVNYIVSVRSLNINTTFLNSNLRFI